MPESNRYIFTSVMVRLRSSSSALLQFRQNEQDHVPLIQTLSNIADYAPDGLTNAGVHVRMLIIASLPHGYLLCSDDTGSALVPCLQ